MKLDGAKFKCKSGTTKPICTYFATLDIETSSNDTMAWSYQQAIAIFDSEESKLIDYKETRDIFTLVNTLVELNNKIENKGYLYIFVHNLSFDLSFFRTTLINTMQKEYSELLTGTSEWLCFKIGALEFRCSYKLTLMSLYTFTKEMHIEHRKLLGENDYGVYYSDDELPDNFKKYIYNDVVGLGEALCMLMKIENLNLRTLPYTSTGFIRNELKKEFRKDIKAIQNAKKIKPQYNELLVWNEAFRGGLIRFNKYRAMNEIYTDINGQTATIRHRDFISHYPTLLLTRLYPISNGTYYKFKYDKFSKKNDKWLKKLAYSKDYLIVAKVRLVNYKPRKNQFNLFEYNAEIECVSSPDLRLLYEYHDVKRIVPLDVYVYRAGHLPQQITNCVKKYFTNKSILKEKIKIAKQTNSIELLELEAKYSREKSKLNGIGGLLQQKPWNDTFSVDKDGNIGKPDRFNLNDRKEVMSMLDNFCGNTMKDIRGEVGKGKCFSLVQGLFMTAYGREELFRACATAGWDNVLYSDTDSLFYITSEEVEKRLAELNERYRKEALDNNAYVDIEINGQTKRSYLSWLDDEGETITRFKALSAKRYCYFSEEHGFKIVCSSILKGTDLYEDKEGNAEYKYTREMELAGLNKPGKLTEEDIDNAFLNFEEGFTFKHCTPMAVIHFVTTPSYYNIDSHQQYVDNGIKLAKTEITLRNLPQHQNLVTTFFTYKNTISGLHDLEKEEEYL